MLKLKRIFVNILASLILILSLSTATGCVFDPTINVKRDGANAYVYNGERYVYTKEMDQFLHILYSEGEIIGYAYNGIGQKYRVVVSEKNTKENVIIFQKDYYFRFACYNFYVKESIPFPNSPWEAKYSLIKDGEEIEISFQLTEVLAKSPSYKEFSEMEMDSIYCYLQDLHPICIALRVYVDSQNNMYMGKDDFGYYKVIDEKFKAAVMQIAFD